MKIKTFSYRYILILIPILTGCQKLNFILPDPQGKALGAACAQNNESLEVCFRKNPYNNPAEIQTGWIDMFEYMKKEGIKPFPVVPERPASSAH